MGTNSADLLLRYFEDTPHGKSQFNFSDLWAAIADIEQRLPLWQRLGHDLEAFKPSLAQWKREVLFHTNEKGEAAPKAGFTQLQTGDLGVLRWVSTIMRDDTATVDESQLEGVRALTNAARDALLDDPSLPDKLRLHIAQLLLHIEGIMDRWDLTGGYDLEESVERLVGLLRVAEEVSTKKSRWEGIWSEYVQPVLIGVSASAPQTVLSITQVIAGS